MFGRPVDYLTLGLVVAPTVNASSACDSKVGRGMLAFMTVIFPGGGLRRDYYGV
jgi:hypothetical protein